MGHGLGDSFISSVRQMGYPYLVNIMVKIILRSFLPKVHGEVVILDEKKLETTLKTW